MANQTLPEQDNPGQEEYEALVQREQHASSYHQRQQVAAGDPTDPRGNDAAAGDSSDTRDQAESKETQAIAQHENQVGSGYKKSDEIKRARWIFRNRRAIFGGGLIGSLIAAVIFFIGSGPLQFVHIAHLLEQWHFSSQQDQQDNRFTKEVRYAYYASNGEVEKTRLGLLGNKLANTFESKLSASGFSSAYSPKFGLFDGYVIDRNNEQFKGMSDNEIKTYVKDTYGVDVVDGSTLSRSQLDGKLVISTKGLGYFKTKALTNNILTQAKMSKISASVGARIMCKRAGCTLHPLKLLSGKAKSVLEDWWNNRNATDEKGATAVEANDESQKNKKATAGENNDQTAAQQAVNDTNTGATGANQDPSKFDAFKQSTSAKLLGGGAAAIGVLCIVKSVNANASEIKQTQVVFPLIRMGTEIMAVGGQEESGQDLSASELGKYSALLNGKDSSGNYSSWAQAQSIEAEEGHTPSGDTGKPNGTLTSIGQGTPFAFIDQGILGTILGPACSLSGTIVTGVVSIALDFTGVGALVGQLSGNVMQSIISAPIIDQVAHWLAGSAVNVTAVGADFGNDINYGAKLAANDQALAAGGVALSSQQSQQLAAFEDSQAQANFQKHDIAYKLFNPYDQNSALSKVIDNTSPNPGQDFARMGSMFLNFGHMFASLPKIFSSAVRAAPTPYDYGFPTYGFSQTEMDDPSVENPYENACYVVGCTGVTTSSTTSQPKPFFTVSGSNIQHNGKDFVPYGISIMDDLALSNWQNPAFQQATDAQIQAAAQYWHANTIRIQVAEENFVNNPDSAAAMQRLQQEVDEIESLGKIPIISDNTERIDPSQHSPTSTTIVFWQNVTNYLSGVNNSKYNNAIFDIYNEPATDGSVWQKGGSYQGASYVGMQNVVNTIRNVSNGLSNNLILVEGPKSAATLAGLDQYPITGSGLAFAYHHVDFTQPASTWQNTIGLNLKTKVPIVDGEWTQYASTRTYECYANAPKDVNNYFNVLQKNHIGLVFWSLEPGVGVKANNPQPVADSVNGSFSTNASDYSQPTTFPSNPNNYKCQDGPGGNLLGQGAGSVVMNYFAKYSSNVSFSSSGTTTTTTTSTLNIPGILADANGNVTPTGQAYIDKAKACFGVNISQGANGEWDVTNSDGTPPNPYANDPSKYDASGCTSGSNIAFSPSSGGSKIVTATATSNQNWLRVRMFIMDTETMNSMACYAGSNSDADVQQACSDVDNEQTPGSSGTTTTTSGSCSGNGKYSALVGSGSSFAGVDQGIDFVPSGGSGFNICAPASGTIVQADATGHHFNRTTGQTLVVEKLDQASSAPNSSQYIYYAEIIQINNNIQVGTHVNKGDIIGTNNQSPGIEVGWASGSGGPQSGEQPLCGIGIPTPCGTSFNNWVQSGGGT